MAPFDPLQLLKLLSPLLSLEGGIKGAEEVPRLSSLMKKFSKKLVSRCVYCNVLKATKPDVLNAFLDLEGWMTINMWLVDARDNKNDAFLEELLSLCLELPMSVVRLKQNNTAKLVKTLTKSEIPSIRKMSMKLVESWMKLIKGATPMTSADKQNAEKMRKKKEKKEEESNSTGNKPRMKEEAAPPAAAVLSSKATKAPYYDDQEDVEYDPEPPEVKVKHKEPRPKTVKTLQTRFRSTGLIEEAILPKTVAKKPQIPVVDREVIAAAAKKRMSTVSLPSFPEKKVKPASLITPASDVTNGPGIKLIPPKPRPVHILHESAGFMDALDAAPVQPLRKKKTRKTPSSPTTPPATTAPPKLQFYKDTLDLGDGKPKAEESSSKPVTSSGKESPERKTGKESPERKTGKESPDRKPGKESPDRKPGKESPERKPVTPEPTPAVEEPAPAGPVLRRSLRGKKKLEEEQKRLEEEEMKRKKLQEEEDDEATEEEDYGQEMEAEADDSEATQEGDEVPMDVDDKSATTTTGDSQETEEGDLSGSEPKKIKSILLLTRKRDRKKSVRWVEDDNLKQFFYFEMDENERVNVNNMRNFGDLKSLEMKRERMNFETARRRISDNMCEGMTWRPLILVDIPPLLVEPGINSSEKVMQMQRQKTTLEEIYFNKEMLPDTPHEPDPDLSGPAPQEPVLIPGEDLTNPGVLMDYSSLDLPPPKTTLPSVLTNLMMSISAPFGNAEEEMMEGINSVAVGGPPAQLPYPGDVGMPNMHPDQFTPMIMQQQQQQPPPPPLQQQMVPQQPPQHQLPLPPPPMQGGPQMGPGNMQMWGPGGGGGRGGGNGGPPPGPPNNWSGPPMGEPMVMYGGDGPPQNNEMMGYGGPPPHQQQQQEMFQGPQHGMRPMRGGPPFMGGGGGRHHRPHRGSNRGGSWRMGRPVCKHFMAGTCRFGNSCNFLHPGVNGPNV